MKLQKQICSQRSKELIKELHKELTINNRNWHAQKSNNKKRAAELIISALAQLTNNGEEEDIEELLHHSIKWLNNEIKDPGCPNH